METNHLNIIDVGNAGKALGLNRSCCEKEVRSSHALRVRLPLSLHFGRLPHRLRGKEEKGVRSLGELRAGDGRGKGRDRKFIIKEEDHY